MIACCNIWGLDDYNRVWETYLRIITIRNPPKPYSDYQGAYIRRCAWVQGVRAVLWLRLEDFDQRPKL